MIDIYSPQAEAWGNYSLGQLILLIYPILFPQYV